MKKLFLMLIIALSLSLVFSNLLCADEIGKGVKVTYLGHAAFKIVSARGIIIYNDPFLSNNPKTSSEMKTVGAERFFYEKACNVQWIKCLQRTCNIIQ